MRKTILAALGLGLCLSACDVIFETDLTEQEVVLLAPGDGVKTERFSVNFWWDPVAGASDYQLQIVSPNWDQIEILHLDSLTTENQVTATLEPGEYAWAVRGINSAYSTDWFTSSFTIDSTQDLSQQVVTLRSPINNVVLNTTEVIFQWDEITIADQYEFQLFTTPQFDTLLTTNTLTRAFPETDGSYSWRVVALNSTSEKRSNTRSFSLDFTDPIVPSLESPADSTSSNANTITFVWSSADSDIAEYSFYLYESNQTTLVSGFPITLTGTNYVLENADNLTDGTYYWTVDATDNAGNIGPAATSRRIIITP